MRAIMNLPYRGCNDNNNIVIDLKYIEKRMSNINIAKSAGCDGIHPRVLKELSSVLAYPLKLIFEHSFRNKELPIDWLSADITVIFKKGKKTEAGNYRPVSLNMYMLQTNGINHWRPYNGLFL
jgi:hypothetical protein